MNDTVKRCTTCILSENFPNINFDADGVCNFCRDEMISTTNDKMIQRAQDKIATLIKEKKGTGDYDAVVCYSGGKDSTYTLMLALEKYDLKVLALTLDNGFISEAAFENIRKIVDITGVDHMIYKPAVKNLKKIFKASALHPVYNPKSLIRISAVCYACISIVNMSALKLALEKNIPFIISGFTLGQIPANSIVYKNNYRFLMDSRQKSIDALRDLAGPCVDDYFTIKEEVIDKVTEYPFSMNILCLEDISEADIIKKIQTVGWESPKGIDGCSSNCLLNTFNNYIHHQTHGYNPYELELSHLIKKGQLSRDEALSKIYDQPLEKLDDLKKALDISDQEITNIHK